MVIVKKTNDSTCLRGHGEKGQVFSSEDWPSLRSKRTSEWRFLKKIKIKQPYDPARPFLGRHPNYSVYVLTQGPIQSCSSLLCTQQPGNGISLDVHPQTNMIKTDKNVLCM